MENPDDSASMIVEALRQCLTEETPSGKTPRGLDKALDAFSQSFPHDRVLCAFLKQGFTAWYAYFLASGHIKEITTLLSTPTLEQVAADVSQIGSSESVNQRIQHVLYYSDRGTKRCRILKSINVELPPRLLSSPDPDPDPSSPDASWTSSQGDEGPNAGTELASPNPALEWQTFEVDWRHQYAWPKARNLPFVFPHYLCTAIVKIRDTAAVLLSFPANPVQCRLVFDISAKEVQHIAKELFGVHIQTAHTRRFLVLESGVTVDINESIKLRGASNIAIDKLFGQMVGTAFRHGSQRLDELANGEMLSNSLTMKIWEAERSPGRLNFTVDAENLSTIWRGLWQDTPSPYAASITTSS
ncbi:hypothetical protein GGR57DRAFT_489632 [Xylariaceae sp. FL1272]|nr:hypothetical protein GGR57DRAFT_489632 [Xylariaceae sp. FL1272]